MNRAGLGLAVGAGYLLGRTKKLKMAIAVGTFVAGRRMNVGPRAIADLVSGQLRNNPQFKELGDQLRGDLRGVGKAASSAMIERQLDTLAGRLHDRTAETRDRLAGVVPGADGSENDEEEPAARGTRSHEDQEPEETAEASDKRDAEEPAASESSGSGSRARKSTAPAKKAGARKTAAKKTSRGAKAAGSAAKTASGARRPKGGGDR